MGNLAVKKIAIVFIFFIIISLYGWCQEEVFLYDEKGRRDPFVPLVGEGARFLFEETIESIEGIYVEGIVWDPAGESFAIINGEIVKCGDVIGGFQLKEIRKGTVELVRDGESYVVSLIEEVE